MDNTIASEAINVGSTPAGDTSSRMPTANKNLSIIKKPNAHPVKYCFHRITVYYASLVS